MRKDKKDEEANGGNPYIGLDKSTVVQEVSCNDPNTFLFLDPYL